MYIYTYIYIYICIYTYTLYVYSETDSVNHKFGYVVRTIHTNMGWLWLVGSIKLYVSFAKEPYKRDDILQKRPII